MKPCTSAVVLTLVSCAPIALQPAIGSAGTAADDEKKPGFHAALEILEKSDDYHYGYKDVHMELRVIIKDKDGSESELEYETWTKDDDRLFLFSQPPGVDGSGVLIKGENTIYVYEPKIGKVRRIGSHAKKQSILGMDYTMDEMATMHLHKQYDPELVSEDENQAILWLEQKPSKNKAWPNLKVFIDKTMSWAATKIEYYGKNGKKHKTEIRGQKREFEGQSAAGVIVMKSHTKRHSTTTIISSIRFNTDLPNTMFSKHHLLSISQSTFSSQQGILQYGIGSYFH